MQKVSEVQVTVLIHQRLEWVDHQNSIRKDTAWTESWRDNVSLVIKKLIIKIVNDDISQTYTQSH